MRSLHDGGNASTGGKTPPPLPAASSDLCCLVVDKEGAPVWVIDLEHWPRACLRAELIERGYDAVGFETIPDALVALSGGSGEPELVVVDLAGQTQLRALAAFERRGCPIVAVAGAVEAEAAHASWSTEVLLRPVTLGEIADEVDRLLHRRAPLARALTAPVLRVATELVARGWAQHAESRDAAHHPIHPASPAAASWSVTGAIYRAVHFDGTPERRALYEDAVRAVAALVGTALGRWNDAPERTQAEVVAALDRAATIAGATRPEAVSEILPA
jgi:hypothetical protein